MIETTTRSAADYSANALLLASAPIDSAADASLLFAKAATNVLAVTGKGVVNSTQPANGTTVDGTANYAALAKSTFGTLYDTGVTPGASGFTMLMVFRVDGTPAGNEFFLATGTTYGIEKVGTTDVTFKTNESTLGLNSVKLGKWYVAVFDIDSSGNVTVYVGADGTFAQVASRTETGGYVNTSTSFKLGGFSAGYTLNVAQVNIYKGANRPSLATLQIQYKRLKLWYGLNGGVSAKLPDTL